MLFDTLNESFTIMSLNTRYSWDRHSYMQIHGGVGGLGSVRLTLALWDIAVPHAIPLAGGDARR